MKIMFGKYKGQELSSIPDDYLNWLIEDVEIEDEELREAAEEELSIRKDNSPRM